MERHNSGTKQGFHSKMRIVGLPSKKPPPKTAKKWTMTAEALASLSTAQATEPEQENEEDTSELTGLNFDE